MVSEQQGGGGGYAFAQKPQAVAEARKYRDPSMGDSHGDDRLSVNIMWDRRVVRGNTYAAQVLPATAVPDPVALQKDAEERKLRELKARQKSRQVQRPSTPEPVAGRRHMVIQTDNFLEEIADRPAEMEVETQTDPAMDRPPSPLFLPMKTGVDRETQIEEGDLFDFDFEVEPILQVMVGKTLEQSLMEVLEEEELANMRSHQDEFDQIRAAELAEAQRMEEVERRRHAEKERRIAQERQRIEDEKAAASKVAARGFSHRYIGDMLADVFGGLEETGFFYDPLVREIEETFVPWLMQGVGGNVALAQGAENAVHEAVVRALQAADEDSKRAESLRLENIAKREAAEKARQEEEAAAAAAAAAAEAAAVEDPDAEAAAPAEGE